MVKIKVVKQELIGTELKVVESENRCNIGLKGRIIDETKNTLTVQTDKGKKRLIKTQNVIEIKMEDKKIRINGKLLQARPEERIRK